MFNEMQVGGIGGSGKKSCAGYVNGTTTGTFTIPTVDDVTGETFTAKYFSFMGAYSSYKMSGNYNADLSENTYVRNSGNSQDTQNLPNPNTGLNKIESGVITLNAINSVYYVAVGD